MAPVTLSKAQFLATAAAKKPGASYQHYLHYVANARANKLAAPPADPYSAIIGQAPQPFTPGQIQQQVSQATAGYAPALTPGQIQQQATGEISPLVAAAVKAISDQAAQNGQAITGVSQSLAKQLAGINYAAPYNTAEQGQAAVDAALQASLNNTGSNDAADLSKRLAAINDPAVSLAAAAVGQNAGQNAGTQVAQGSNALADLIANQAANVAYGQKQPGIAQLAGLQQLGANSQQANQQIAAQTQSLEAQLPSIISDLTSQSNSNQNTKASAGNSLLANLLGINENRSHDLSTLKANDLQRLDDIAAQQGKNLADVQTAKIKAAQAGSTAATKAKQPNPSLTTANGYLTANDGTPIRDSNGNLRPIAGYKATNNGQSVVSTKQAAGGTSSSQVQNFLKSLPAYQTVTTKNADGSGSVSKREQSGQTMTYTSAYKWLRTHGVDDPTARTDLAGIYKRGENGRAWLTNEEQAVLKTAQANTAGPGINMTKVHVAKIADSAGTTHSAGFLSPQQAEWLQAAKKLPPGEWGTLPGSTVKVYWIKPTN